MESVAGVGDEEGVEGEEDTASLSAPTIAAAAAAHAATAGEEGVEQYTLHTGAGSPIAQGAASIVRLLKFPRYKSRYSDEEKLDAVTAALRARQQGSGPQTMLRDMFTALLTAPTGTELRGAASPPLRLLNAAFTDIDFNI